MLYLSAIILSFFLSFLLITKKNKSTADFLLATWLSVTGFHLFTFYLFFTNQQLDYPVLVAIGMSLPLTQGPFLYLYSRHQTSPRRFQAIELLHFVPVLLSNLMFARFYLLSFEEQADVFRFKGRGFEVESVINLYAIYISGILYIAFSLRQLLRFRKNMVHQFSNTEKINFNWLLYLIIWEITIWSVILISGNDRWIFGCASLFVLWLGYFGIRQVQVFTRNPARSAKPDLPVNNNTPADADELIAADEPGFLEIIENPEGLKYQKSHLSEKDAALIQEKLRNLLDEQKPFTNPDLTLNDLAKSVDVHPNILSQVINSKEKKNFYDLINERRVQEFIRLFSQPVNQQYTLVALAYDCGFNSKASFNRNFKKYTGSTPTDYLRQQSGVMAE
jgi:AraC-like DNA-binding protein